MSPMVDIQRRHAEVFRIRMGDKAANGAPRKLTDKIRVTAPSEAVIQAFVDVYGGEVQPWNNGEGAQFEAYLPTTELSIVVLPGQSIQQWWELYKGSVCERRCDGETETLSGRPCMCPAEIPDRMKAKAGTACKPMTRVNVICPDVECIGAGGLVSHGLIAAETLPQSIAVAEAALARGMMVPAVLRIVEHKGKKHFIVPQIEIVGLSLIELASGDVNVSLDRPRAAALDAPKQKALPARTAPEMPPLPGEDDMPERESAKAKTEEPSPPPPPTDSPPASDAPPKKYPFPAAVTNAAKRHGIEGGDLDDIVGQATDGARTAVADLDQPDLANKVIDLLKRCGEGELHLTYGTDGHALLLPAGQQTLETTAKEA